MTITLRPRSSFSSANYEVSGIRVASGLGLWETREILTVLAGVA
ncbi:MAG TPA: hypothetical protein VIS73_10380 [Rhodocyclaceae bacterium]